MSHSCHKQTTLINYNVVLMMASSDNPISILLSAKCRNGARRWKQHHLSEKRLKDLFAMLDMEKHLFRRRFVACLYFGSKVNDSLEIEMCKWHFISFITQSTRISMVISLSCVLGNNCRKHYMLIFLDYSPTTSKIAMFFYCPKLSNNMISTVS